LFAPSRIWKKHIRILGRAAQDRMIGRESALAMLEDAIHIDHARIRLHSAFRSY